MSETWADSNNASVSVPNNGSGSGTLKTYLRWKLWVPFSWRDKENSSSGSFSYNPTCAQPTPTSCPNGVMCNGASVTGTIGQEVCGSNLIKHKCTTSGWSSLGTACSCSCDGTRCDWVPVKIPSGGSVCGTDLKTYTCTVGNWSAPGAACTCPVAAPEMQLTANPQSILNGEVSRLTWSRTGGSPATSCSSNFGVSTESGAKDVYPSITTDYSITCSNGGGSRTATAKVTVCTPGTKTYSCAPESVCSSSDNCTNKANVCWESDPNSCSSPKILPPSVCADHGVACAASSPCYCSPKNWIEVTP